MKHKATNTGRYRSLLKVVYFYNLTKGNERAEWRESKISKICENVVEVDTGRKGPKHEWLMRILKFNPNRR